MNDALAVGFESAPCDHCGSAAAHQVFQGPDRLLGLPGVFTVVRCEQCGLLRQNPRPTAESIGFYYPPSYEPYSTAIDDERSLLTRVSRRYGMTKRRRAIERLVRMGQLLDVGSATGNFLYEMQRSGNWEVEGVEPNVEAAAHAEERFGLKMHRGELGAVSLAPARYDVITMWNVIEHLHAPMSNLREVARLLKDGGVFVFSIPNLSSWEARWFGPYWMGWELPRHLYYPSQEAMAAMLDEVGLEVLHWDCLLGAYPSFLLTLRFRLQAIAADAWWVRAILALCNSAPMQVAAIPIFGHVTRVRRASLITGFARRRIR